MDEKGIKEAVLKEWLHFPILKAYFLGFIDTDVLPEDFKFKGVTVEENCTELAEAIFKDLGEVCKLTYTITHIK